MNAFVQKTTYSGGMHWKKSKNKAYLFRTQDRHGNGHSFSPRSLETEIIFSDDGDQQFSVNRAGSMVDLVKAEPKSIHVKDIRQMGDGDDLATAEIRNLQWLLSSQAFSQTVIGDDGFPATMIAPDHRAFALHQLWLSRSIRTVNRSRKK